MKSPLKETEETEKLHKAEVNTQKGCPSKDTQGQGRLPHMAWLSEVIESKQSLECLSPQI